MKIGLIVIVALLASAFAAHALLQDPGYVVIQLRGYVIEMSVPVLVGVTLALVFLAWLIVKVIRAPRQLGRAAGRYRSGRAGQKLTRGMIQIAEGNFSRGEKLLTRNADVSDAPLLNFLNAARAAHLQGQYDRRDEWLRQAYERMPEAANAVLLTQAEFQIDQQQYESALATLKRIEESSPDHSHALTLLGRLYFRLADWKQLGELLPRLRKHARIDEKVLDDWTVRVHTEALASAADEPAVQQRWKDVPSNLRSNERMLVEYFRGLQRVKADDAAEKALAKSLKREWRPALVEIYGTLDTSDPEQQLQKAESWLAAHPEDPDLLLAAARLCLRCQLWGKARGYLESVIALRASAEAYQLYGSLLDRLGEDEAAADAFREGLGLLSAARLPALARPGDSHGA